MGNETFLNKSKTLLEYYNNRRIFYQLIDLFRPYVISFSISFASLHLNFNNEMCLTFNIKSNIEGASYG
jgi:hypothetical protein